MPSHQTPTILSSFPSMISFGMKYTFCNPLVALTLGGAGKVDGGEAGAKEKSVEGAVLGQLPLITCPRCVSSQSPMNTLYPHHQGSTKI